MKQVGIKRYCHVKNNKVYLDGALIFEDVQNDTMKSFLKSAYRNFKIKYPKFFKMDEISKLGFLAAEVVLQNIQKNNIKESEIGIVLANSQSTLVTDKVHQESINDLNNYYPSPSVFVYTLPNIMIGEISIKHKFRGENAFYIFEHFNTEFVSDFINMLFTDGKVKACLGGWIDQSEKNYEAFVYWVEHYDNKVFCPEHTGALVRKLYEKF
jgi:hypothetical protein